MTPLARILQKKGFTQPPWWANENWSGPVWSSLSSEKETIDRDFEGYIDGAYKANGVVFACILTRLLVFTEARFQWRRYENGRPTDLFGDPNLKLIEDPWPGGTTGEVLAHLEQDASLAGNAFLAKVGPPEAPRLRRLRPDWVSIVTGSPSDDPFDLEAKVVGYIYKPLRGENRTEVLLTPDRVMHYSPIPDPDAQWRGMSWLTPVVNEIMADSAATKHKLKFFENGASLGLILSYDPKLTPDQFNSAVAKFTEAHEGIDKAYKTLHVGGGVDPKVYGADLKQLDFKVTQGAGETRIAMAAGVHPVMVGMSEGLAGASLNAGNFAAARRRFSDGTIRPLWRIAAASLQKILTPPEDAHLWYDDRDIAFLREDAKEEAGIRQVEATTIRQLVDGGFAHDSVIAAIAAGDWSLLEHSGLFSVQLQPAGAAASDADGTVDGATPPTPREIAEMIQKIYLGVGVVISTREARAILNRAGAGLDPGSDPTKARPINTPTLERVTQ